MQRCTRSNEICEGAHKGATGDKYALLLVMLGAVVGRPDNVALFRGRSQVQAGFINTLASTLSVPPRLVHCILCSRGWCGQCMQAQLCVVVCQSL